MKAPLMTGGAAALAACAPAPAGPAHTPEAPASAAVSPQGQMSAPLTDPAVAASEPLTRLTTAEYLDRIAANAAFETELASLAIKRSRHGPVITVAKSLLRHHTATAAALRLRAGARVGGEEEQATLRRLASVAYYDFDLPFWAAVWRSRKEAWTAHQSYATYGDDAALRAAASAAAQETAEQLVAIDRERSPN